MPSRPVGARTAKALAAICDALVPPGGDIPEGALDVGAPERIEAWLDRFTPSARRLVKAMILAYDLTPLLSRHMKPLHRLAREERVAWIAATAESRLRPSRDALAGLRTVVNLAYAVDPRVQGRIGYDGAPLVPLDAAPLPAVADTVSVAHPDVPATIDCDVVVVGSGAGGAVTAYELASAGLSVVVLEEGGPANGPDRPVALEDGLFDVYRDNGITTTLGSPVISLPMGRAVGGTTVINSGTCFRTPDAVLHAWSRQGIPAVTPEDMAPVFDEVEAILGVAPVPESTLGANAAVFRRGADALGYSGGPIRRNARSCHGHGRCAFGCPIDAKQGMAVSYLPRAVAAGARVFAHCRVRSIDFAGSRARGVRADVADPSGNTRGTVEVNARAVVLSAGAIFTPALLARHRRGGSSGQLGRNLVIHPGAGTTARFDEELHAWRGVMQSYYVDEKLDRGVLLEATFPPPGVGYSAGSLPGTGLEMKRLYAEFAQMAACGSVVSDAGAGRVVSTRAGTLIWYSLTRDDARKVLDGIATACEIYLAAGAREAYPMLPGFPVVRTRADVDGLRHARISRGDLKLSAYHPMGTARMGPDPARSVVDPWGQVHGVEGLWALDASILPSSTMVNPQITIMAMATRGARRLATEMT